MYRIGICDDGINICSLLEDMILHYTNEKKMKADINVWYTGEGLLKYLKQEGSLDILFLDIELFQLTGIEVGSFIRNKLEDRGMQIIYISGKASYARQLFKTQPTDFLVKPITQSQVNEVLGLAIKIIGRNAEKFEYQNGRDYYYVPYGEIIYFVSEGRKIKIVTQQEEKEFYGKIKELKKELPSEFLLIHQSYIINTLHVARYTYEMVELTNGTVLTVSKAHRKKVRESLLREE